MKQLLDAGDNVLMRVKSTDVITIESIIASYKAETNALAPKGKAGITRIKTRSDTLDEADCHNLKNQAVIGANEGATEAISILVGSNVTDCILRSLDGNDYKGMVKYMLHKVTEAAIASTDRTTTTNVLD